MSGYRDTSSFDPNGYDQPGAPLRPFNWVQWCGVVMLVIGLALDALYFAGRLGWIAGKAGTPTAAIGPIMLGVILINSRRQPGNPVDEEQRTRNRTVLIITVAVLAAILGAVMVIEFTGVR